MDKRHVLLAVAHTKISMGGSDLKHGSMQNAGTHVRLTTVLQF